MCLGKDIPKYKLRNLDYYKCKTIMNKFVVLKEKAADFI
jgi:hypothetical protein